MSDMVIDVHIHFGAKDDPASGCYWSKEFESGIAFFAFRLVTSSLFRKMDIGYITKHLLKVINGSKRVDKCVLLAMDQVYDENGKAYDQHGDGKKTHLRVPNAHLAGMKSGFALLQHGPAALLARAVLADLAASTIDVQYYIYEDDLTGILLTQKLLDAADRGVRVRILLDDNNLRGSDEGLKLFASHPSIEIRVFNPYRVRARWMRPLELMVNFGRLQRRMHNKIFAVDGVPGIFGGRNIGNNYFDAHDESNFADFDVFVAGPLIGEATASFESYWTHPLAVPAEQLTAAEAGTAALEAGCRGGSGKATCGFRALCRP